MAKQKPKGESRKSSSPPQMQTTAVHLTRDLWELLRRVAFRRAEVRGGRASVSELLRDLIEAHRDELETELKRKN